MAVELLINVSREESRVARLENWVVTEISIERDRDRGIVGNVYKGRVVKVLPGMQAAFVDIGLAKAAFLYVTDVSHNVEEYARFLEEETGEESVEFETARGRRKKANAAPIEDLLREGQEVIVQVAKAPIGGKGARVTSHVSLPGRTLVYMPTVDHVGVSRRIADEQERKRLRDLVLALREPGKGYIVRTVAEGATDEDLRADARFLSALWENVHAKGEKAPAVTLLHSDLDLVLRTVRDTFTSEVDRLVIDDSGEFDRVLDFVKTYLPALVARVELYQEADPLFDAYRVEIELSRILGRKVWLKSGGSIVIDSTEALTAVDVNTGRYVGRINLEETILKTNLEAAREIAYQLRLRNIGGIIIVDFIDMEKEENQRRVLAAFEEALSADRAKMTLHPISSLGLVQMTRKRVRENLVRLLCEPCPYCDGKAIVKSSTTVCYEVFREIRRRKAEPGSSVTISVHPDVADLFFDEERAGVEEIEKATGAKIVVKGDPGLHREQFEVSVS
ncbi:MAG: Rne/Rng family ribonuclease [Nitrospirota bacterium]